MSDPESHEECRRGVYQKLQPKAFWLNGYTIFQTRSPVREHVHSNPITGDSPEGYFGFTGIGQQVLTVGIIGIDTTRVVRLSSRTTSFPQRYGECSVSSCSISRLDVLQVTHYGSIVDPEEWTVMDCSSPLWMSSSQSLTTFTCSLQKAQLNPPPLAENPRRRRSGPRERSRTRRSMLLCLTRPSTTVS